MAGQALAMMPWFPRDFMAATRHWHLYERALYRELLDSQWELGVLPEDETRLARIVGLALKEFLPLWAVVREKFVQADGGGLINKRLEEHRQKALEKRERKAGGAQITNAKRSAKRSAERDAERDAKRNDIVTPPSPSPSTSLRSVPPESPPSENHAERDAKRNAERDPRGTSDYREHWLVIVAKYPPKPIRANWIGAERSALRLVESGQATWFGLLAGVERYAAARRADGLSVMNPEKFFSAEDQPWAQAWPMPERPVRQPHGGLTESAKRWGEDDGEEHGEVTHACG